MAQLPQAFDATQVAPNRGPLPPLPTDWYNGIISESEIKLTKKGAGKDGNPGTGEWLMELTLKVLDGPKAGHLVWDRLNLGNLNTVAAEIANGTLSAICHATGIFQVADTQQLHGVPLMFRAVETPPKDGYEAGNDIKGYAKVGEKESKNAQGIDLQPEHVGSPATPTQPGAVTGAATAATPPWAAPEQAQPIAPPVAPTPTPAAPTPAPTAQPIAPPVAPAPVPPPVTVPPTPAAPAAPTGAPVPPPWATSSQ